MPFEVCINVFGMCDLYLCEENRENASSFSFRNFLRTDEKLRSKMETCKSLEKNMPRFVAARMFPSDINLRNDFVTDKWTRKIRPQFRWWKQTVQLSTPQVLPWNVFSLHEDANSPPDIPSSSGENILSPRFRGSLCEFISCFCTSCICIQLWR